MTKLKKVVVIIPTYNEYGNINPTSNALLKVFKTIKDYDMHILFVDDNSPDKTADAVHKIQVKNKNIHLLLNKRKGGLGKAYKKGMKYALDKLRADIVFQFDADLSHDPTKIPLFLKKLEDGADVVLGTRYRKGGGIPEDWPIHRKFLSVVSNIFVRTIMLNPKVTDWTGGYRALKSEVVRNILPQLNNSAFDGYAWQIGFLTKTIQSGYKIDDVPFHFVDRKEGYSKLGFEYIINALAYVMKVRIESILKSRVFKFAVVGGIGALVQIITLNIYRRALPFQLAFFLSIETSILSNFIWNNIWTFKDRKLKSSDLPKKFIQFNLTSGGSIIIQQLVAIVGQFTIGLIPLFTVPIINFAVDTGTMYAVVGILMGMFWNFFAYNHFIWKKKK